MFAHMTGFRSRVADRRFQIGSCVCMYICEGCMLAATFACIFVLVAYQQLRLHVCSCRLHVVDGYVCVYVGDAGYMSAATLACMSVQVAYRHLSLHVRLCRLHVGG